MNWIKDVIKMHDKTITHKQLIDRINYLFHKYTHVHMWMMSNECDMSGSELM